MKYLLSAAALAAGLFVTAGTASAQPFGNRHNGPIGHAPAPAVHVPPRVVAHPAPAHGFYRPGYGVSVLPAPVHGVPAHGGVNGGHGYDRPIIRHR